MGGKIRDECLKNAPWSPTKYYIVLACLLMSMVHMAECLGEKNKDNLRATSTGKMGQNKGRWVLGILVKPFKTRRTTSSTRLPQSTRFISVKELSCFLKIFRKSLKKSKFYRFRKIRNKRKIFKIFKKFSKNFQKKFKKISKKFQKNIKKIQKIFEFFYLVPWLISTYYFEAASWKT